MPPADPQTRARILHLLKTKGALGASALARRLSVTASAVRQQVARLEAEGLVAFEDVRGQVGRPRRLWRVKPAASAHFPDSHTELATGLLEAARSAFGLAGIDRLIRERVDRQAVDYHGKMPPPGAALGVRVAALARIRETEGYLASSRKESDGTFLLVESHCPICAAASACTGLCAGELDLFRRVLGPGVEVERTEHVLSGGVRCAYRISKGRTRGGAG